ncbi:histone deacetylase [Candidatus Dependentiae bacterium]|nr:histone deacetylase [Candidatus Dependentiae bacterium]
MKAVAELCYSIVSSQCRLNGVMVYGSRAIKAEYKEKISNLYTIIETLVNAPEINKEYCSSKGISAASICRQALKLLSLETLIPPYKTRTPEKDYVQLLQHLANTLSSSNGSGQLQEELDSTAFYDQNRDSEDISDSEHFHHATTVNKDQKLPIVFSPNYDISAYGIERFHPFDAKKYGKIWNLLTQTIQLNTDAIYTPTSVSDEDLALVHTPQYISSLKSSTTLGILADMDSLGWLPNRFVEKILLDPVKLATGGTILASQLALKHGWAINISGGYHHAKSQELVRGFCIINDICIAAKKVQALHSDDFRIMIVDLDAHQGNGHEELVKNDRNIAVFDMYNKDTWPADYPCQERINFDYPLQAKTQDNNYMQLLIQELPKAIEQVKPHLIIYNAGTDIYEKDPLGMLSITRQGIIKRDEFVFRTALNGSIPIVMVLSGGYHADSYSIIAESIENLWRKLLVHTYEQQ